MQCSSHVAFAHSLPVFRHNASSKYSHHSRWVSGAQPSWIKIARNLPLVFPKRSGLDKHIATKSAKWTMMVDPWSVSPEAADAIAAQFFALSLFPYLGFLYYLAQPETKCPPLATAGFRFLLVFVFCSIPAGIYAKTHYHDILANIDWLHGSAESLLTITNILIVLGMRSAVNNASSDASIRPEKPASGLNSIAILPLLALFGTAFGGLQLHPEPLNALSFPTWIIHVSSIIEWLMAMSLVYEYAKVSRNPRWKALTWAMIPLHTSGLCACTYHFFYNAASLNALVTLQAALTFGGNVALFAAAYSIYRYGKIPKETEERIIMAPTRIGLPGFEDLAVTSKDDSSFLFLAKVFVFSTVGAAVVKWGEPWLNTPFSPSYGVALAMIFLPTALNTLKWFGLSRKD